jgi:hypothetical protein
MAAVDPYLRNNLHCKPLCARLGRAVLWGATSLNRQAAQPNWRGLHALSRITLIAGAVVSTPIALIETVALFIIGIAGLYMNDLIYDYRSQFLQKHTLKCLSYAFHSLLTGIFLCSTAYRNHNLLSHMYYVPIDHLLHLGTAAVAQLIWGGKIDQKAGRPPETAHLRTLLLFTDNLPLMLNDIADQFNRESGLDFRERLRTLPFVIAHLARHPEDRPFIDSFSVGRLQEDDYRHQAREVVQRYLADYLAAHHEDRDVIAHFSVDRLRERDYRNQLSQCLQRLLEHMGFAQGIELNSLTPEERAYQERLSRFVKAAFLKIHDTPRLSSYLDRDGSRGTELLESLSVYGLLIDYAQYLELLEEIHCPKRFTGPLATYNKRRNDLIAAQESLRRLTEAERGQLVEKLLRGSDYEAPPHVQDVYLCITRLSSALMQGPLVTRTAINAGALERGGQIVEATNIFQEACREAQAEIDGRLIAASH